MKPEKIQTEVFLLPCCSSVEKEGSISNSSRLAQWRYKAIEPLGQLHARRGDPERAVFPGEETLPEGKRGVPRSDPESHLGVRGEGRTRQGQAPGRSQGRHGDQRVLSRRRVRHEGNPSEADRQERGPGTELREPAGRRIDLERELALQRELHPEGREGRQHDGPQGQGRPDRPRPLSELGMGMAAEPEDHLQPRLRRPERESLGPEPPGDQMEPGKPRNRETGRVGRRCPRRAGPAAGA